MRFFVFTLIYVLAQFAAAQKYYGARINKLSELHHAVSGEVYAVDSRTLFIKRFNYDGEGPAAYFYVGNSKSPSSQGSFRIRDERGSSGVLGKYRNKDITLTLPEGKTLRDIKWFSVWCDEFSVNFGNIVIPKNLDFPRPKKVGSLKGIHAVQSDNIVIVDAQTLLIPNFSYDGVAPDAKFWVGQGQKPSPNGIRIADENGKESPLRRYDRKTIVLTLPDDLTVFEIGHFGVWCEAFTVDFGHVLIPSDANVPPSLKMLGVTPQSKLNCEVLHDELAFEVRWAVAGDSVVIQLVAKLDDNEYMSFGVSKNAQKSVMIGGDVVVAWVNRLSGKGYAQDYYLESKSQCSGNRGSCPDTRLRENSNSIRLLNAAIVNDYSIVTYQRPLKAADSFDQHIFVNGSQAIIWAVGKLNQRFESSYHSQYLKSNKLIDFGRQPFWNCPLPDHEGKTSVFPAEHEQKPHAQKLNHPNSSRKNSSNSKQPSPRPVPTPKPVEKRDSWEIPAVQCNEPEDGVFYAQIGPTGGKMGYSAITGHVGWGISWYINGLLIPQINVVRNKTYTFVVEGGNDADTPAKYHPFYITDDPIGGFQYKSEDEQSKVKILAGVHQSRNGKVTPTGAGRICNWMPDLKGASADEYSSFGAYQRSLTLQCDEGEPGIITWTPDSATPDLVYYQCFSHRYLGWKINVLDSCDEQTAASGIDEVFVETDVEAEPSIKHENKLLPSDNFLQQHEKDLIKHHNMNGAAPKVTSELQKTGELNKLLSDGIRAAEALEERLINGRNQSVFKGNEDTQSLDQNEELIHTKLYSPDFKINRRPLPAQSKVQYFVNGRPTFIQAPQPLNYNFLGSKLPPRHAISVERRPLNRFPPSHFLLPQQSSMINHYKKAPIFPPPPNINRHNIKSKMPFPLQNKPMRPLLLLGEPTEIKPTYKKAGEKPPVRGNENQKSQVDNVVKFKGTTSHDTVRPQKYNKRNHVPITAPFKAPFNVKNESFPIKSASNTGFKEDTIIVESGFRPIFRREDVLQTGDSVENIPKKLTGISSRSDNFGDIIYESNEDKRVEMFEPMFVPSPKDFKSLDLLGSESEKKEFFYLPPKDSKLTTANYDLRAILDTSLLTDPLPSPNDFIKLSSKTKQFIKDTPQFAPFKGEVPSDLMLQLSTSRASAPITVISTKLSAVNSNKN